MIKIRLKFIFDTKMKYIQYIEYMLGFKFTTHKLENLFK